MKKYKVIIGESEKAWHFEGPEGSFMIEKLLLPVNRIQLQNLLQKIGLVVEFGEVQS